MPNEVPAKPRKRRGNHRWSTNDPQTRRAVSGLSFSRVLPWKGSLVVNRAAATRVTGLSWAMPPFRGRYISAVALVAATGYVASAGLAAGPSTAADQPAPAVNWKRCPSYSDAVIRSQGVSDAQIPQFRAQMKRLECGTVSVPLDYRHPNGRKISIAITRLGAVDKKRRLGSIAYLTGGPGSAGYLTPITKVALANRESARLNDRYDLIGIDPRGVNYSTKSTKTRCENPTISEEKPGPLTKAEAKKDHDAQVADNRSCGRSDPAFFRHLNTMNVVRDLDRVRAALHERKLNLYGVSYGTWLGVIYHGMFPDRLGRAFLDSVAPPRTRPRFDESIDVGADAAERDFARMAAWLARRHTTFGLGATAAQVRATVLELAREYDRHPKQFTDLKTPIDGMIIALLAAKISPEWPPAGKALAELRRATGPKAPPAVKEMFEKFGGGPPKPIPGAPETLGMTMHRVVQCNEEASRVGFSSAWTAYQQRLKRNPVTGRAFGPGAVCAGWPLPVQQLRFQRGGGSLVLSGHRHEQITAYEWTLQMQATVGGKVYTIDDDVHTAAMRVPECAADVVAYFTTGRIDRGCQGVRPVG
ncbi:alpha/beta fold hydrolase [Actinomadura rubrisoli]|uniref:Alpha/beta hydrolase n=1 Tax=Actinomadura rubrisoli TaxID=2530368 RepID=A0A4V2YZB4_9ACTN|nr:alpha/beta hydrolase [Actinomadura rubrisoli]TDD96447.1 alpha/beta hydrolase [Actinomadura rubrisoli]